MSLSGPHDLESLHGAPCLYPKKRRHSSVILRQEKVRTSFRLGPAQELWEDPNAGAKEKQDRMEQKPMERIEDEGLRRRQETKTKDKGNGRIRRTNVRD